MTFYNEQVLKIRAGIYPKEYLCRQVIQSKLFIDYNFSKNIKLTEIAGKALFSKFHFLRLFKRIYGRAPYQYLTEVRIAESKKLLLSGMAVSEVCLSVGFESVTSFTGLFKKITGTTPSAFQNKKKTEQKSNFEEPFF